MVIKIKKILVALDGSKNSFKCLDVAINLARQCQASITCLYVLEIEKPHFRIVFQDQVIHFGVTLGDQVKSRSPKKL